MKFRDNRIKNNKSDKLDADLVTDRRGSKCKLVQEMVFVNTCVKFRDNRIRNKKICQICQIHVDLVFDHRRSKCELLQEMMFVNTCVKFCDNGMRNNVCRVVQKTCQI